MKLTNLTIARSTKGASQLAARFCNRHGLITGATGSGKTVSIMRVVESLSTIGTPCLVFDAKGDLSGLATSDLPATFIDVFGQTARAAPLSFEAMGADATARALGLSQAQSGVLDVAFAYAARARMPLATPTDMRAALARLERGEARDIGHVAGASAAVVRRALIRLDGSAFAARPFDVRLLLAERDGRGLITILDARALSRSPALYSATVVAILSSLFDRLPDIGDAPRPTLAIFIDESHLVFDGIEPALSSKLESIARLIRSRGVSLWFASQAPSDIPPVIAAQLANRIQHAMRAATRADMAQVRAAAESMPGNVAPDAIGKLSPGEALISLVGANGAPSPVQVARIIKPACRLGGLTEDERAAYKPAETAIAAPARDELRGVKVGIVALVTVQLAALSYIVWTFGAWRAAGMLALAGLIWAARGIWPAIAFALLGRHHRH